MVKTNDIKLNNILISDNPFGVINNEDMLLFTVSVPYADECSLKLYRSKSEEAVANIPMNRIMGNVFQVSVNNQKYKADSYLYQSKGKEFIDPYAKKIIGREKYGQFRYRDEKSRIRGSWEIDSFDWDKDVPVFYRWADTILYKLHVRGFTKLSDISAKHRGTYLGIIDKVKYLKDLGITSLLLMPCVEFDEIIYENESIFGKPNNIIIDKENDKAENLPDFKINYWGYTDKYNYFAPKASYASKPAEASYEFKHMVKVLHQNGIEVLMEMEFKTSITQRQMIDCLKYWADEYHIDGFKINTEVISEALLQDDPWISEKKLITADQRDCFRGYEAGYKHNTRLASYNQNFLNDVRMFIKGDENKINSFIVRTSKGVTDAGVINFITDNNGYTLMDLFSYESKHNEDNREENRDGTDYNFSWNCGVEGKTKRKDIIALRLKMRKNAIAALLLSQGTPMIYSGDEFGNSQNGNNNAYCQDNPVGWIDWKAKKGQEEFFKFINQLILIRKTYTMLHYPTELRKMDYISCGCPDITFHGRKAWYLDYSGQNRALGIMICGKYAKLVKDKEEEDIYILYNMHWEPHIFDLPSMTSDTRWELIISTEEMGKGITSVWNKNNKNKESVKSEVRQYMIAPRSVTVFINRHLKKQK